MSEEAVARTTIAGLEDAPREGAPRDDPDENVPALAVLDGKSHVQAFLDRPTQHGHIVQFYEAESFLIDNVAQFVVSGIRAGEPIIIIATPQHREVFAERLVDEGVDVEHARASGQLAMLDAREVLAGFMVGEMPDWEKFRHTVGAVLENSCKGRGGTRVRAYGEMVDLLWREDNRAAAIALEEFWNDLEQHYSFSLLCAYVMANFYRTDDAASFERICKAHTHVIPAERSSTLEVEGRASQVDVLQQRARSLEAEIAHRKELEIALRDALAREKAARQEAERNIRYNEMFAGTLGHDLRNPLGTILMGANYIARLNMGDKPTRSATRIAASAERMSRMVDQLLDFTRIRVGGGLELHRTRIDLAEVCDRVKDELEAGTPQCSIVVEARGNTSGVWDYDRLLQVFSNIVGNAVCHGASSCHVSIHAGGTDVSGVTAKVHNAGAIAPELLPSIFEPFRGRNKRHRAKGLGLGLFITRQIVLAHAGTISVTSNDVEGTTVRVTLPRFPPLHETRKVEL